MKKIRFKMPLSAILAVLVLFSSIAVSQFGTVSADDSLSDTPSYVNTTYNSSNALYDYSEYDFDGLGTNLVPDSTVSCFEADGTTYKTYYDPAKNDKTVLNANAWWDKPSDYYQGYVVGTKMYLSAKKRNLITNDTTKSHTNDGSGAIVINNAANFVLPEMEAKSYYVVTFWLYSPSPQSCLINFFTGAGAQTDLSINTNYVGADWKRVTFVVYTGASARNFPFIQFSFDSINFTLDELAVYKIDATYGQQCVEAKKLVTDDDTKDNLPDTPAFVNATYNSSNQLYDYAQMSFENLGTNIVPDSTVTCFEADGTTYKAYYDPAKNDKTILDANAWWDKPSDYYHGHVAGTKMYLSAKKRGFVTSDTTKSRSQDGSGALTVTDAANFVLPEMEQKSYYVVTLWVYNSSLKWSLAKFFTDAGVESGLSINTGYLGAGWKRISFVVYTGANYYDFPYIQFGTTGDYIVDEVAVYKVDDDYGQQCIDEQKLITVGVAGFDPLAVASGSLSNCNFDMDTNIFTEGSFESGNYATSAQGEAKFGNSVYSVNASGEKITLPTVKTNTYYMLSLWVKTKGYSNDDKFTVALSTDDTELYKVQNGTLSDWTHINFTVYTALKTDYTLDFEQITSSQNADIYVDGISVIELSEGLSLACYALDTYPNYPDIDRLETAKAFFENNNMYSSLNSPILSTNAVTVNYSELYEKLRKEYDAYDRVSRGFAPSGSGIRNNLSTNGDTYTCDEEDNIFSNASLSDNSYWFDQDATGYENYASISNEAAFEGDTSLKVSGSGIYKKLITGLKTDTIYYLVLEGMSYGEPLGDMHFGFMDTNNYPLENPLTSAQKSFYVYYSTYKQQIQIQCQDGTWYNRVYRFETGDNTELYFFITSTLGEYYLDNIRLFEASDAIITDEAEFEMPLDVVEYEETKFACDEDKNLITNWDFSKGDKFWGDYNGFNKFVEVATSEGNRMLHFKSSKLAYYYLPTVDVEANKKYTLSYWTKNLNGEGSKFGVVLMDAKRYFISEIQEVSEDYGEWSLVSITFNTFDNTQVSLGVYDNGGEAVFDKIRLFESSNGYDAGVSDMPVGGDVFTDSKLGSDGVTRKPTNTGNNNTVQPPEVTPTVNDDDDDESAEETVTVKKVVKKYKKGSSGEQFILSTWAIVLIVVGSIIVLGGIVFLIILFVRRKKRNKNIIT